MISNLLKGITEYMSVREIKKSIEEVKEELIDLKYKIDDNNKIYNIEKIIKVIDKTDIYDLFMNNISEHLNKLIILIEFSI